MRMLFVLSDVKRGTGQLNRVFAEEQSLGCGQQKISILANFFKIATNLNLWAPPILNHFQLKRPIVFHRARPSI